MGKTWNDVETNSKHYKALGITRVYLSKYDGFSEDYPWHLATEVTEGGSRRLDISTSLNFAAKLDCGIKLEWCLELEDRNSNGNSQYQIDANRITDALGRISDDCATQMRAILAADAEKIRKRANEFMDGAKRQFADAAILERLAKQ